MPVGEPCWFQHLRSSNIFIFLHVICLPLLLLSPLLLLMLSFCFRCFCVLLFFTAVVAVPRVAHTVDLPAAAAAVALAVAGVVGAVL